MPPSLRYSYYSLTVLGMSPSWKVHMTILQLTQFAFGVFWIFFSGFEPQCRLNDAQVQGVQLALNDTLVMREQLLCSAFVCADSKAG